MSKDGEEIEFEAEGDRIMIDGEEIEGTPVTLSFDGREVGEVEEVEMYPDDGVKVQGSLVFDEETAEMLNQDPDWMGMIPRRTIYFTREGEEFEFFSPTSEPEEVELEVKNKPSYWELLKEVFRLEWRLVRTLLP